MKVNYEREVRFSLEVAMVKLSEVSTEGRRCDLYDYTNRTIFSDFEWKGKIDIEIKSVNKMTGTDSQKGKWVSNPRNGRIF